MSRTVLRWLGLGIVGFALVLLARLPSRWFSPLLPAGVHCQSLTGTLWRGHCAQLRWPDAAPATPLTLDSLGWTLHPLALLRGRIDADLQLAHRGGRAQARVTATMSGRVQVEALSGNLSVDRSLLAALPAGWSGEVAANALGFSLHDAVLESLRGDVQLRNLQDAQGTSFGSFEVKFGDTLQKLPITGVLHDLDGPLAVAGTIRIEANGAWQIDGRVTPGVHTPPALVQQIRVLGLPDAAGAYPFSVAGLLE